MERKKKSIVNKDYPKKMPYQTRSVCPECKRVLEAEVYPKGEKVYIKRTCPEHGKFDEIYWDSVEEFNRAKNYVGKSIGLTNTNVSVTENTGSNCPFDCGICSNHQNHTALANIAVTNRCDLSCWYCFFFAKEGDPIYEPSLDQIKTMLKNLKAEKPVPCNAIQYTGGEPTLREDILDIVKASRDLGYEHVQLNTHGISLALKPGFAQELKDAGVSTLYLSFDGTTPQANPKNHYEIPRILEECRKVEIGIVLVPTVIMGLNDNNLGDIVDFALRNIDVVRGIDFQPVSFVGRMPKAQREAQRITIPKAISLIEEQTNEKIKKKDFFSIPCVSPIVNFVEALTNNPQYTLNTHFACGAATYVFVEGNKVIPLPEFVDVDGLFAFLKERSEAIKSGKNKRLESAKLLWKIQSFIDKEKQPKGLNLGKILFDSLVKHDYDALGQFHTKTLFIGMMHFMDPYNYDQQRVERCQIHYAMPDGRIIPFCSFNVIPELYRDKVQDQYSVSWEEWSDKHNHIDPSYKYKRDIKKLQEEDIYKKTYKENNFFK